ncbi:MAG: TatD family hydrolase [Clostridia bacterium]|jgi:TatD DNase family protein|nr:TatD family hydrolase [Clostridia bacterium]
MLFDTHAHIEDKSFLGEEDQVIKRAQEAGVSLILTIGYNYRHSIKAIELANKYDMVYATVGLHPHDAKYADQTFWDNLRKMADNPKVVALGEMGLDYYRDRSPRDIQREVFRTQINLARELKKPIVIHDRDAHQDVLDIIKEEKVNEIGGVFHAYSGSWEMAKIVLDLGLYIAIGGPVTFKNARKVLEVAEKVPLDRLVLETDCPYLTPHPYRGKRNEPAYVKLVAEKIAEIRGISFEEVAHATKANGMRLFGIREE